jgi:hypothetical protein
MSPPGKSRFWRRARLTFRWFRITVWLLVLAVVCAVIWLNRVGLPGFLQQRLLSELRAMGLDLSVERLRMRWYRGIVAEQVRFQPSAPPGSVTCFAEELVIRPDLAALLGRHLRLRGVSVIRGTLVLPLAASNAPVRTLVARQLHAQVDFLTDDRWQLSTLEGECLGVEFHLSGTVTNASALLAWQPKGGGLHREQSAFWNQVVDCLERIVYTPAASLKGSFSGDGAKTEASSARVTLSAPGFRSPWADGEALEASVSVAPHSNTLTQATVKLSARAVETRWGRTRSMTLAGVTEIPFAAPAFQEVRLNLETESPDTPWGRASHLNLSLSSKSVTAPGWVEDSRLTLKAVSAQTRWGKADGLEFEAGLRAVPTNAWRTEGSYRIRGREVQSEWLEATGVEVTLKALQSSSNLWPETIDTQVRANGLVSRQTNLLASWLAPPQAGSRVGPSVVHGRARSARLESRLILPPREEMELGNTNLPWAERANKVRLEARTEIEAAEVRGLEIDHFDLVCGWEAPQLSVRTARATLYGGEVSATAQLEAVTRRLTATVRSELDPHRVSPFVTTNASAWKTLAQWEGKPLAQARLSLILPNWTNRAPDRGQQILSTLELAGEVAGGAGTIQSIPILSAAGKLSLTNHAWQVQDVEVVRPEGALCGGLNLDSRTKRFQAHVLSTVDPIALRPLLASAGTREALDDFRFGQPPVLEGEIAGRWDDWSATTGGGRVALTNVTFREQAVKSLVAGFAYTNQMLDFLGVRIEREEGRVGADLVRVDLGREAIHLTNIQSTIEVSSVAHAIGPHIVQTLQPYQFAHPPTVHFQGTVGIHSKSGLDDARFEVSGGPFQWQKFRFARAAADLHWLGETLTLTNFAGTLKGGEVRGDAWFDFTRSKAMDFRFHVLATNVDAKPLLTDLFPTTTNTLEGLLGGRLTITNANTVSDLSWFGHGDVSLRDGLIWDVPMFRYLSPILNGLIPGLGNNRARQAAASFFITNSVIATRDLEIRASPMRMQLDGTVDFEGRANGKVEAEMFRETPGLGWMLSRVLLPFAKILSYKVSGTLGHPKLEPLYIPRILTVPFHPLKSLKQLFIEEKPAEKPNGKQEPPKQ